MSSRVPAAGPLYVRAREPLTTHERAKVAARAKWGERRILRLDELDPTTRGIVLAIVEARKNAAAAPPDRAA